MGDAPLADELIAWAESVWDDAGVVASQGQIREMAYVAGRTIVQTMYLPYAEKNGGVPLVIRYLEALATVPGWDPVDLERFLESYDSRAVSRVI